MIVVKYPRPVLYQTDRVFLERGLALAVFGLADAGNIPENLEVPASLRVACVVDKQVYERQDPGGLHAMLSAPGGPHTERVDGWTVDVTDLPEIYRLRPEHLDYEF